MNKTDTVNGIVLRLNSYLDGSENIRHYVDSTPSVTFTVVCGPKSTRVVHIHQDWEKNILRIKNRTMSMTDAPEMFFPHFNSTNQVNCIY